MSGEAKVLTNGHIWILAHLEGFDGWYPQGNGERTLKTLSGNVQYILALSPKQAFTKLPLLL